MHSMMGLSKHEIHYLIILAKSSDKALYSLLSIFQLHLRFRVRLSQRCIRNEFVSKDTPRSWFWWYERELRLRWVSDALRPWLNACEADEVMEGNETQLIYYSELRRPLRRYKYQTILTDALSRWLKACKADEVMEGNETQLVYYLEALEDGTIDWYFLWISCQASQSSNEVHTPHTEKETYSVDAS